TVPRHPARQGGRVAVKACAMALAIASLGCASSKPIGPATAPVDDTACGRLCADEARCAATPGDGTCRTTCARDEKILRAEVIDGVVACRIDALKTTCAGPKTAFTRGDLLADTRCLKEALAAKEATTDNRRAWSEASCDRMLRCQTSSEDVDEDAVRP